jgi:16S rRNA (adenine1518-N6/adenine1519-N6)-dimethyltransferase
VAVPKAFFKRALAAEDRVREQGTGARRGLSNLEGSSLAQAKSQLRRLNVRVLKGLGQHFLVDRSVLETIISAAELGPGDTVVEVGPGLGILTEELVRRAGKVIAVEVDSKLAIALGRKLYQVPQLTVLNANVLELEPGELVSARTLASGDVPGYKVVANLPYYIASPILRHFLEALLKPNLMVVMVQKEVGQSIVAEPGGMSLLGVSIQLYGKPTIVAYVPALSFYPQPKVKSAIVRIDVYPRPAVDVADASGFFKVVKAGFSAPRKQLRNALSLGLHLGTPEVIELLEQAGIAPQRRPQTLSLEEWAQVYRVFASRDKR